VGPDLPNEARDLGMHGIHPFSDGFLVTRRLDLKNSNSGENTDQDFSIIASVMHVEILWDMLAHIKIPALVQLHTSMRCLDCGCAKMRVHYIYMQLPFAYHKMDSNSVGRLKGTYSKCRSLSYHPFMSFHSPVTSRPKA
jgi:hypothetical protein